MTTQETADRLVELCKAGKNFDAMKELYADNIVSVEGVRRTDGSQETSGKDAVIAKSAAWASQYEINGGNVEGPYLADKKFAVVFDFDVTSKATSKTMALKEVGIYTVESGKIVREEFLYENGAAAGLAR